MTDAARPKPEPDHDLVLVHGCTEDGEGYHALRSRPGRLDAAVLRPMKDGRPLGEGELVRLREREGSPLLWDVDVEYRAPERAETPAKHAGPPQVATDSYRRGWDAVFGREARAKQDLAN